MEDNLIIYSSQQPMWYKWLWIFKKKKIRDYLTQKYTEKRQQKYCWFERDFNSHPRGQPLTPPPVELLRNLKRCAHLIQFKRARYPWDDHDLTVSWGFTLFQFYCRIILIGTSRENFKIFQNCSCPQKNCSRKRELSGTAGVCLRKIMK